MLIVDAYKGRDVAVVNVSGAYQHMEWSKKQHMILKLESRFVDIMCDVYPEYKKI